MTFPEDCVVRLIDLPVDVGGFITESPDGIRNIYINARYSDDGRREALRHELRHAENDDLHSPAPVAVIEARAAGRDPRPRAIPALPRASELLKSLPPVEARASGTVAAKPTEEAPMVSLTPHQARVLLDCLADLDRSLFEEERPIFDF